MLAIDLGQAPGVYIDIQNRSAGFPSFQFPVLLQLLTEIESQGYRGRTRLAYVFLEIKTMPFVRRALIPSAGILIENIRKRHAIEEPGGRKP
jgi:hypothetical protein